MTKFNFPAYYIPLITFLFYRSLKEIKHLHLVLKLCIIFISGICSCNNVQKKETNITENEIIENKLEAYHINPPSGKFPALTLSQIADSISYIPLETKNEILVNHAEKQGDRFYAILQDKHLGCFDHQGKFLHKIGQLGSGPEEYISANHYTADPVTNQVYVKSSHSYQHYNECGEHTGTIKDKDINELPIYCYNNLLLQYHYPFPQSPNKPPRTWWKLLNTSNGEIKASRKMSIYTTDTLSLNHSSFIMVGGNVVYQDEERFYYYSTLNDTVFCIEGEKNNPAFRLHFDKTISIDHYINWQNPQQEKNYYIIPYFFIKNNYALIFCRFISNENPKAFWALIDREINKISYYNFEERIINDLDGGPDIKRKGIKPTDFYILPTEDLKNDKEVYESYFTEKTEVKLKAQEGKFQQVLTPLVDDANPVMRIIHWKKSCK